MIKPKRDITSSTTHQSRHCSYRGVSDENLRVSPFVKKPHPLVLIGLWLIFFPGLILCPVTLFMLLTPENRDLPANALWGQIAFVTVYFTLSVAILYSVTLSWLGKKREGRETNWPSQPFH